MTIQLTHEGLRGILPRAPQEIISFFVSKQAFLDAKGITHTRTRLAYFFANIEHECGGFTIKNLTESLAYTPQRAHEVWPARYPSAAYVAANFGNPIDRVKFFDVTYGERMGNRKGTHDGSTYIGRGGPQVTGLDGYINVAKHSGVPIDVSPALACAYEFQPEICAGFWDWKNLNRHADTGNFTAAVKAWNGGTNGMADRLAKMAGNEPMISRLKLVEDVALPGAKALPGSPPSAKPPKEVVDNATKAERTTRAAAGTAAAAGAIESTKPGSLVPDAIPTPPTFAPIVAGVSIAIILITTFLIARKNAAIIKNWF